MNTADKDALHAAILNLPDGVEPEAPHSQYVSGFIAGHKAARHAAAELVSASLVAPQEVRMLTETETYCAWDGVGSPMRLALFRNIVKAAIEEFCRVNGLSIKEQAVKPAIDKEMPK